VQICVNTNWQEGMGSSLRAGLATLLTENLTGVLIMLCDQPLLTASHLDALIHAHTKMPERIIASDYGERCGVPCLFPASFFPDLNALTGDAGARELLRTHRDALVRIPFPEGLLDIDTPEDWQRLADRQCPF
jgi:molybdenum cofactor cytidylyltransferase